MPLSLLPQTDSAWVAGPRQLQQGVNRRGLRRPWSARRKRDVLFAYGAILPAGLIFMVFIFVPVAMVVFISLTEWDLVSPAYQFVGLRNYVELATSGEFHKVLLNTLYFVGVQIPLDMALSLAIALMLNAKLRGTTFYRALFFTPVVTPMVAVAAIWLWIYEPEVGLANYLLGKAGLGPLGWLDDPAWSMPAVILTSVWKGLGYDIVIFLAGLQNIPKEDYEAAAVDGADGFHAFRRITLPLLSPVTYFVLVMSVVNSFKVFTQVHVMTPDGGPLKATSVIVFYLYTQAFERYRFGRASAVAVVLFGIVILLTVFQRMVLERRVHYQ
ncbi:MAG: sugar ABC transporter permease [Limnochordaceae bacterium]|nr:sugar ABC transporter permease [Limnochordaceae bacterium]